MIHFCCSRCQKRIRCADKGAGRKMHCPRCGERLLIPPPVQQQEESIHAEPSPAPPPVAAFAPVPPPVRQAPVAPAAAGPPEMMVVEATSSEWEMPLEPGKSSRAPVFLFMGVVGLTIVVAVLAFVVMQELDKPAARPASPRSTPTSTNENTGEVVEDPGQGGHMEVEIPNKGFVPPRRSKPPSPPPPAKKPEGKTPK